MQVDKEFSIRHFSVSLEVLSVKSGYTNTFYHKTMSGLGYVLKIIGVPKSPPQTSPLTHAEDEQSTA